MKQRMLIIGIRMSAAGTEKSFLSFAKHLDFEKYDVELLLAEKSGDFLPYIPKEIKVTEMGEYSKVFSITGANARSVIWNDFVKKDPLMALKLLPYIIKMRKGGTARIYAANRLWVRLMKKMPMHKGEYDIALAYWGDHTMFYMVDKVCARKKISWLHFDYDEPPREDALYLPYFEKCDKVVTVSERIEKTLAEKLPSIKNKIVTFENIIDKNDIRKKALEHTDFCEGFDGVKIMSVGRLCEQKGFDLAIPSVARLIREGVKLRYYIIGTGEKEYKEYLLNIARESGAQEHIVFLPPTDNPYKFMARCDVYLQPSRHEGKPITVEEAKALAMPICATSYKSANEQLAHGALGEVCEISSDGIYKGLSNIIFDKFRAEKLKKALSDSEKRVQTPDFKSILG